MVRPRPELEFDRERSASGLAADNRSARVWHRWRNGAASHQSGNLAGLLPTGHPLRPDQGFRSDRPARDQIAELRFRIGTLLLAAGRKKPGSIRHFAPKMLTAQFVLEKPYCDG